MKAMMREARLVGGGHGPRSGGLGWLGRWGLAGWAALVVLTGCQTSAGPGDPAGVRLEDVVWTADLERGEAAFTLRATAKVESRSGGVVDILRGRVALTDYPEEEHWRPEVMPDGFRLSFDRRGEYAIELKFQAGVEVRDGWNAVSFGVAPGPLQRVVLRQLPAETEFRFPGAAKPERVGEDFLSVLPVDGQVALSWKDSVGEGEGKLFYAAEAVSQVTVGQGLLRQTTVLDFKVMQGELNRVVFALEGAGEVTRIQGQQVLAWNVEAGGADGARVVTVRLNQSQRDAFQLVIQLQQSLGVFPLAVSPPRLRPEGATRFAGYTRVVNEGAVRLEVVRAEGLSQISPEQFPANETLRGLGLGGGAQTFAYRFSGAGFELGLQADNILPELGVSEVLVYHLGESELAIDAELELDVREAPLRELELELPSGYALARLVASGMSDYFTTEGTNRVVLRVVYGAPVSGRQLIQLRLERNAALAESAWELPGIGVPRAKSVRGHVGVSADAGFRVSPSRTEGLTEIATAFFPKQIGGLQQAFRLGDPDWQASLQVERLAQSIQADAFHLFSVSEGIAYGSSVINYMVSGAPVSTLRVALSDEYYNVEFTGREIRNWQQVTNGYVLHLHTPVSGAYMLLATYERPFRAQGETLGFSGATPLDAQVEQGHSLVISDYQFEVKPVNVSSNLLALEPGEVPAEYRLFFDAPVLAAYRYSMRPFNLQLELRPLQQGETLNQVVDRAVLATQVSAEGQVLTDARYFVKSKGAPWFRLVVPAELRLWSASVDGESAVPVSEGEATLIPLAGRQDPDSVQEIELKLAGRSPDPALLSIATPRIHAPVLLTEWTLNPDAGHRLVYQPGTLTPVDGPAKVSGFDGLRRFFSGPRGWDRLARTVFSAMLLGAAVLIWRKTAGLGLYRFSARHIGGGLGGLAVAIGGLAFLVALAGEATQTRVVESSGLRFLIPVQQAEASATLDVVNEETTSSWLESAGVAWPLLPGAVLGLVALVGFRGGMRAAVLALAWVGIAWGWLRAPNGAPGLFVVAGVYAVLHVLWPAWRWLSGLPRRPAASPGTGSAAVTGCVLLGSLLLLSGQLSAAEESEPVFAMASSVTQEITVQEGYARGEATIVWGAEKGQVLPVLVVPAVLTSMDYPEDDLERETMVIGERQTVVVRARRKVEATLVIRYGLKVEENNQVAGFALPTQAALVQRVTLRLPSLEADILAPSAVTIRRESGTGSKGTVAELVLSTELNPIIGWKPRSRDTRNEASVFYAEVHQVYVPSAGVLEGLHHVLLRPAQGEIREVNCSVPEGFTIADVTAEGLSTWRFDPDNGKLRLTFSAPQSRAVAVAVRSQLSTGTLPYQREVGVLRVEGASGQIGLLAVATGNEVQLERAEGVGFTAINLEDFPAAAAQALQVQTPGLAVRRAFRYGDDAGTVLVDAAAVEPDVRLEAQQTLSLGEDRVVLAASLQVAITRAGIFRLVFALPDNLDVESITGAALSHWTMLKDPVTGVRMVTLHLRGKTEGQQKFDVTLSGPGMRQVAGWAVPRVRLEGASKQRGQLVVVPEQGMRLQVQGREGVTQLDPLRSGIRQRGVLVFRLLQDDWRVALDVEQVDSWIQVTGLQDVTVGEGQVKVLANLQYEIENTGVKSLRLRLPAEAEGVRFKGDQVADYLRSDEGAAATEAGQQWEVKLHRRMLGSYLLQVSYQVPVGGTASRVLVRGVEGLDANLQRGFLTVRAEGRLQLRVGEVGSALQTAEWQSIPRRLLEDVAGAAALHTYRLVEPSYELGVDLERHEAVKLLPARVNSVALTSVVSDDGVMLTQARVGLVAGDKRLLSLKLPESGRFWFAFVNQRGVWPWQGTNGLWIPLEKHSSDQSETVVEFFYTLPTAAAKGRSLDLRLAGPQFDLPLENVTWNIHLNDRWELRDWEGTLELREQRAFFGSSMDLKGYMQNESVLKQQQIQQAENLINMGNSYLQSGDPQQARRAFQAAYGLSKHDDAFNEDARVQLHNLKMQQALIGLNNRVAVVSGKADAPVLQLQAGQGAEPNYTQEQARQIIEGNTAEDNAVMMRLAERLVQQQEAAVPSPAAIRAAVPESGRVLSFTRALLVDDYSPLSLHIEAHAPSAGSWRWKVLVLGGLLGAFLVAGLAAARRAPAVRG